MKFKADFGDGEVVVTVFRDKSLVAALRAVLVPDYQWLCRSNKAWKARYRPDLINQNSRKREPRTKPAVAVIRRRK